VGADVLANISNTSVDIAAEKSIDMTRLVATSIRAKESGLDAIYILGI
jgi:hypothetical protein